MSGHVYINSNPAGIDSNCAVCDGKWRDNIHHGNKTPSVIQDGEFTIIHAQAMTLLNNEWQRLPALRKVNALDGKLLTAINDLVWWNLARELREPIVNGGTQIGERLSYRLA